MPNHQSAANAAPIRAGRVLTSASGSSKYITRMASIAIVGAAMRRRKSRAP